MQRTIRFNFIKIFFLVALFLTTIYSQDDPPKHFQNNIRTFEVNFEYKTMGNFNILEYIQKGDFYRIKIDSINQYLYNIKISVNDTILQSSALTMPSLSGFNTGAFSSMINELGGVTANSSQGTSQNYNNSKAVENPSFFVPTTHKIVPKKEQPQDKLISDNKELIIKDGQILDSLKNKLDGLMFKYNNFLLRALVVDRSSYFYKEFTIDNNINTVYSEFSVIRDSLSKLYEISSNQSIQYLNEIAKYQLIIYPQSNPNNNNQNVKVSSLKNDDQKIQAAYTSLLSTITNAEKAVSPDSIYKYFKAIVATVNNSSYTYLSLPMQFSKDRTDVTITIQPKDSAYSLQTYSMKFSFPVKKHFFAGISTGFYTTTLHDEAFSFKRVIKEVDTSHSFRRPFFIADTSYSLINESTGGWEFGLYSMVKFGGPVGRILKQDISLQFGFGPGISLQNTIKPRLLFGGGFAFGNSNMLTVNIGGIIGSVNVLSNAYDINQTYTPVGTSVTSGRVMAKLYWSFEYFYCF